ncbi:hypothetical protein QO010_002792 [Caulobacter ginsengisoli]|uniref:Uncharacterized protein n=1 Tax=Caulobacter ginsengisoli TaxID=400775 RepID=A0ABU0ISM4_9CAUL|nr:hypothetical protein [Caulobacter ginsengisoli]MDQ0465008.1 hypothetical protein [Caulobacter ginsengisoli]
MSDAQEAPAAPPKLPAAYAPFLPVLEQLSEPMLRILQGQLAQFERMARILEAPDLAEHGDFEGYGGLSQRGDLGQIVQSELLLRTEEPLEFLRRLAESETLYHEKRYADPGVRPAYRVMISIGPGSLGHGRMVALAALFFLARIAHGRKAQLHWCFLPRPEGVVWFDALTPETVRRLLRAASFREMSLDDVEAATALWSDLAKGRAKAGRRLDPVDWTVGARREGAAASVAGGALSFRLGPPSPDGPRAAEVALRQGGRERSRASVSFPDDRVCVSALNDPFRPLAPSQVAGLPALRRELVGWEPRYFTTPERRLAIVRLDDGLLILRFGDKLTLAGCWFAALPPDAVLAGVRVNYSMLTLLTRSRRSGSDRMALGRFLLDSDRRFPPIVRSQAVATEHLFAKQSPYAIPPIFETPEIRFYSTSGHAFELGPYRSDHDLGFGPLYKAPQIVGVSGLYHIVRDDAGGGALLRVLKPGSGLVDSFREGVDPVALSRLYGLTYSRSDRSLAYSLAPNRWTLPASLGPRPGVVEERALDLTVTRDENLLSARPHRGGLAVRVWSDLRAGGAGVVRSFRREADGEIVQKQPNVKLGDDAAHIVKLELGEEGILALTVTAEGTPAELLILRHNKRTGRTGTTRFDLPALRDTAKEIDVSALDG